MTRFRRSGKNWEGRNWSVVAPIDSLATQIETAYALSHPTDGTVAGRAHDANSPNSDHRPKPTSGTGVVRAIDFGEHIEEAFGIMDAIRTSHDSRLKYGIHESQMFSSYPSGGVPPFTWRPYGGSNAHIDHGHISTLASADAQGEPWDIGTGDDDMTSEELQEGLTEFFNVIQQTKHDGTVREHSWLISNSVWASEVGRDSRREFMSTVLTQARNYSKADFLNGDTDITPEELTQAMVDAIEEADIVQDVADELARRLVE